MDNLSIEDGTYGDEYPIIFCNPNLNLESRLPLKDLTEKGQSIHLFYNLEEAFKFACGLGISFIIIVPRDCNEAQLTKDFQGLESISQRKMFDFEEEALLKGLSEETRKRFKCYVFSTQHDSQVEIPVKEDEEEGMLMRDLNDMARLFRQEFIVIWYDAEMSLEKREMLVKEADIEEKNVYTNFKELCQRLFDSHDDPPYHLIMTGEDEVKKIVSEMDKLGERLLGLYIYCEEEDIKKSKKIVVQKTFDELVPKIIEGIRTRSKLQNSFPIFVTDFNTLDKSDIYNLHYYLKGLINFRNRKQAKNDFIKLAKKIYQSSKIMEFEEDYNDYDKDNIIVWYTNGSPVYRLLNNCLRIATHDSILYCRYILRDLESAIREQYSANKPYNGLVYRGAYITQEEWEKLESNIGKEIEMYGFLSTSKNEKTAKKFLHEDLAKKIFITIIIPPLPDVKLNEQGFADISQLSHFKNEEEILFNVRSKFKILEVENLPIDTIGNKCRHLVLLYGPQLLRKYMTQENLSIDIELKIPPSELIKCHICDAGSQKQLFGWNQDVKTEIRCFDCLRKHFIPENIPLLVIKDHGKTIKRSFPGILFDAHHEKFYGYKCHHCGKKGKDKYHKWIHDSQIIEQCQDCFQEKIEIEADILFSEMKPYMIWQENQTKEEEIENDFHQKEETKHKRFSDHGRLFFYLEQFDLCREYCKKQLRILSKKRWKEAQKLNYFTTLGLVEAKLENNQRAFDYYRTNLNISKVIYGEFSPPIATAYAGLGAAYNRLGEHQLGLKYHQKALSIWTALRGEDDPETGTFCNNVAISYQNLKEGQQALEYHRKAIRIWELNYGENNFHTAFGYNNLATHYNQIGEHQLALEYHHKALKIWEAVQGEKHSRTASAYYGLASAHRNLGEHSQALEFYNKALRMFNPLQTEYINIDMAEISIF